MHLFQKRALITALLFAVTAFAQDGGFFSKFDVHGNVAQGALVSTGNSYLTTGSKEGSADWDEASLSVSRHLGERLRAGVQLHSYRLGDLGRQNVKIDWAYADYRFKSWFGVRAGKVKTSFGLYNDVQDNDALTPWVFLPQGLYTADDRAFQLAHTGGVIYGDIALSKNAGTLSYSAFGGRRSQPANEGFALALAAMNISMGDCGGPTAGLDVRWKPPVDGLTVGGAYAHTTQEAANARMGPWPLPIEIDYQQEQVYVQYDKGKVTLSAEWRNSPSVSHIGGSRELPVRAWYVMAMYHATGRLALGSYYSDDFVPTVDLNHQNPLNYAKDTAVNARFDFNRHFYAKLEGHYLSGNGQGFYALDNPNGYQRVTRLAAARFGFVF